VVVLAQSPLFTSNVAKQYLDGRLFGFAVPDKAAISREGADATAVVRAVAAEFSGVSLADPGGTLCASTECATQLDGTMLFYDDNHLNIAGSRALTGHLLRQGLPFF
jgi:hypothetical protein